MDATRDEHEERGWHSRHCTHTHLDALTLTSHAHSRSHRTYLPRTFARIATHAHTRPCAALSKSLLFPSRFHPRPNLAQTPVATSGHWSLLATRPPCCRATFHQGSFLIASAPVRPRLLASRGPPRPAEDSPPAPVSNLRLSAAGTAAPEGRNASRNRTALSPTAEIRGRPFCARMSALGDGPFHLPIEKKRSREGKA